FRQFADKREVLFGGSSMLQELMVRAVTDVPAAAPPLDAVAAGLRAAAGMLHERRERAQLRQKIVAAHPELQERELIKLAALAASLGEALRERGVAEPTARLTAQVAIAVFRVAFERWTDDDARGDLAQLIDDSLSELHDIAAEGIDAREEAENTAAFDASIAEDGPFEP
ncbi:MAG TPA: hypothetical protein VGM91_07565, partial [Conexibacter sp.]